MKGKGAITLKGDQIHLQSGSRNSEATGTPVKGDRGARKAAGIADGVTKNAAALQTVLRTHRNANDYSPNPPQCQWKWKLGACN